MFEKLFGRKSKATMVAEKTPAYTVQDIHDEFDAAEDKLLNQAEQVLAELKIPTETELERKAEMLLSLGFHKSADIDRFNKLQKDKAEAERTIAMNREQAELIRYYKQNYPFQKFITEDELGRICEKYGLIYASVGDYKMEVPEKNLKEIAEANKTPLDAAHMPMDINMIVVKCKSGCPKEFKEYFESPIVTDDLSLMEHIRSGYPTYDAKIVRLGYQGEMPKKGDFTISADTFSKDGLFIAAPDTHFDMENLAKVTEHGFKSKTECVVPDDPIVFSFCKGGALIKSKWGAEGEDKALLNEINN